MRILFLTQYFPPETDAAAARVSELARAWASDGHRVTVLTGLPNHPTGIVPPQFRGRPFFRERRDGCDVVRVWLYATPNRGVAKRAVNFASFLASAVTLGAALTERPDAVIATSPQLLVGLAGAMLARFKGVPFVLEVRDLWPKTAIDLGVIRNPTVIRSLERLERSLYRAASRIAIVSEEFRDHVQAAGVPAERVLFVPNGVDMDGALASTAPAPEPARGLPGVTTVAYVGTHGMCQGLSRIVDVAETFHGDPSVRFLFVGDGAEKEPIQRRAAEKRLGNCTFIDAVPRELVASIYRESDICLVPLLDREVFRTVLPSKIFEIMSMERPIVLSTGGRAERLVREADAGLCAPPENVPAIAAAVRTLKGDPELRRKLGANGAAYVRANFDRRAIAKQYAASLTELHV